MQYHRLAGGSRLQEVSAIKNKSLAHWSLLSQRWVSVGLLCLVVVDPRGLSIPVVLTKPAPEPVSQGLHASRQIYESPQSCSSSEVPQSCPQG
jgi:hypothetical protein